MIAIKTSIDRNSRERLRKAVAQEIEDSVSVYAGGVKERLSAVYAPPLWREQYGAAMLLHYERSERSVESTQYFTSMDDWEESVL